MSFIFRLGLKNISLFEDDRFLLPALSFRGIKKVKIQGNKYITGIAVGVRFWRWGIYLSIISQENEASIKNKFEVIDIAKKKVSIAKSGMDSIGLNDFDLTKAGNDND